jgi:EAL domain-containing protein (putative c-di-GMP-specific phosphodiesterase class I)/GGDEF domain-containing protein
MDEWGFSLTMFTFQQLLIRNVIAGLVFILAIYTLSLFLVSDYFDHQTKLQENVIRTVAQEMAQTVASVKQVNQDITIKTDHSKTLTVILKSIRKYNFISISSDYGFSNATYKNNNPGLEFSFLQPKVKRVEIADSKLSVEYQLNFSTQSAIIGKILLGITFFTVIVIIVTTLLSHKRHALVLNIINLQIKKDLLRLKSSTLEQNDDSDNKDLLDMPVLKTGLDEIRKLLSEQLKNALALEQEAYIDRLTQLDNRGRFVQFYEKKIKEDSPIKFGVLCLIRCSELNNINQFHGYNEGDAYILQVTKIIKKQSDSILNSKVFRLNSSDFICVLPNIQMKEAEAFATVLTGLFNTYQATTELESVAYSGLINFDKKAPLGELLALADTAVSIAQTKQTNGWFTQKDAEILNNTGASYGNQNWRQEIEGVIEHKRLQILVQPIKPCGRNSKVYSEVLTRFINVNEEVLPTDSFFAMAEKLDKIIEIDKLIIEKTIEEILSKSAKDQSFGINISPRSIVDEQFMIWLQRKLLREPYVATRLIFEITEHGLQKNIKNSKRLIEMLHSAGSRLTVERFGVGLTSFKFFRDLKPDFIKMDSIYTRDVDDDKNNQYFLRLMVDLAHRLSISVLAEGVETQEEKHTLEKLFIDGCQGFYIGKPSVF